MHSAILSEGQTGQLGERTWKCSKALIAGEVERGCSPPKPLRWLSRENISAENGDPVKPEWFIGVEYMNFFLLMCPGYGGTTLVLIYFIKGGWGRKVCTFPCLQLGSAQDEISGDWWIFSTPQKSSRTRGRSVSTLRNKVVSMELSKCSEIAENNFKRWGKNILAEAYFNLMMFNELAKLCLREKKKTSKLYVSGS